MMDERDQRIITAAALAVHRIWLGKAGRAYLAGEPQPIFDQVALEQFARCAELILEDATGAPYRPPDLPLRHRSDIAAPPSRSMRP
jgi:hypothetical protein